IRRRWPYTSRDAGGLPMHTGTTLHRTAAALSIAGFFIGLASGQQLEHQSDAPGGNVIHIFPGTGAPAPIGFGVTTSNAGPTTSNLVQGSGPVMRNPV